MAKGERTAKIRFAWENRGLTRTMSQGTKAMGRFSRSARRVGSGMAKVGGFARGLAGGMAKIVPLATALATGGFVLLGRSLLNNSARLQLMSDKARVVFGESLPGMSKWAKRAARDLGLTKRETLNLAAGVQDLLIPMRFGREEAAGMTKEILGVAGALAAWSGGTHSAAEVSEILTAALLGEREALQSLGVAISQAQVDDEVSRMKKEGLTFATEEQAGAQATLNLILDKSKDAQNAFNDGAGRMQRSLNNVKSRIREFGENLLVRATPALELLVSKAEKFAIPTLNKLNNWFTRNKEELAVWAAETGVAALHFAASIMRGGATVLRVFGAMQSANAKFLDGFLGMVDGILGAFDSSAMRKMFPGFSEDVRTARADINQFRMDTVKSLEQSSRSSAKLASATDRAAGAIENQANAAGRAASDMRRLTENANATAKAGDRAARSAQNVVDAVNKVPSRKTATIVAVDRATSTLRSIQGATIRDKRFRVFADFAIARGGAGRGRIPARAQGGPVSPGRPYLVGEQGPELIVPRRGGTVLSAQETARVQAGDTHVSVYLDGELIRGVARAEIKSAARATGRALRTGSSRARSAT